MELKILLILLKIFSSTSCWPTGDKTKITVVGTDLSRDSMTHGVVVVRKDVDVNKPPTETSEKNDYDSMMLGDQPLNDQPLNDQPLNDQPLNDDGFKTISVAPLDDEEKRDANRGGFKVKSFDNSKIGSSTIDPLTSIRIAQGEEPATKLLEYDSDRNQRLIQIQKIIPFMIGRGNITETSDDNATNIDISHLPPIEKIVSFVPKCTVPKTVKDTWKDENLLYLFFNVTYSLNATLASAIVKLHRSADSLTANLNNSGEEVGEKLLRVSIYWFSKHGKKQKIKKRLSDSKVITEKQPMVELNIKPAVTSWLDGQNYGFAVKVENQEEIVLKASNFFKGVDCKSVQTFPSINNVLNVTSNEYRLNYFLSNGISPIVSICTVESLNGAPVTDNSNCQFNKYPQEDHRKVNLDSDHHRLRHQKHNLREQYVDIRNLMENTTFIPKGELDLMNRQVPR